MRGIPVGRRNWTFCGSDSGGQRAASIYTLNKTCKLIDVDARACIADALTRLADHPAKRIAELLPWNWKSGLPPERRQPHAVLAGYLRAIRVSTPIKDRNGLDQSCVEHASCP